ncbi:8694_t:CDS:2, partial [Entrophospora sp. SA101]
VCTHNNNRLLMSNMSMSTKKNNDEDKKYEPPQPPVTNKDSNLDIVPTVNSSLMMTLDEGIKAHENGDFLKAWECFNSHHMIGNKLEATYWRGHYLYEGYHGEININEAIDLFKLAADQGIPDAQFSYAKSLIENYDDDYYGGGCDKDILNYLELAAHGGGVSSAFYILGNIYLYGKHNVQIDRDLAIQYLKLAALKNHQDATDLLNQLKIKLF